ncbi:MAG: 6-phosphogluconolactonase [Acidobacteriota bacterium]
MNAADLELFADLESACARAASLTARAAREAAAARGRFTLALSGGSTPARYFEQLAGIDLPWQAVHVFWADERLVAKDDPASNFRLAREHLLERAPIPADNIHPMVDAALALEALEDQAQACESMLRGFFGAGGFPAFDVIHLGVGDDGHTASLFPGQPALAERERWVLPVVYEKSKPPVPRLTLTLPVLNAARLAFFLVSGQGKTELAREIVEGRGEGYPASQVRPAGELFWLAGK